MDNFTIEQVVGFLIGGSSAAALLTQGIKYFFDKFIIPRFQPIITQLILFTCCLGMAGIGIAWNRLPDWFTAFAILMFTIGIAIYEVLYGLIIGKKGDE